MIQCSPLTFSLRHDVVFALFALKRFCSPSEVGMMCSLQSLVHLGAAVVKWFIPKIAVSSNFKLKNKLYFLLSKMNLTTWTITQWWRKVSERKFLMTKYHSDWQKRIFLLYILLFEPTCFQNQSKWLECPTRFQHLWSLSLIKKKWSCQNLRRIWMQTDAEVQQGKRESCKLIRKYQEEF